ncbi:MAG: ABC transporter permease, partial [Nitrososphaerota archaeon]|nr:ABC transporter permease [Nitrososphaerota archaeon]
MASFKRIYVDFKVFSVGYLRNKFGLFFGLIFPVVLILIFGAIFSGDTGLTDAYAQNQDVGAFGQNMGNNFLTALNESSTIRVITVDPSENFADFLATHSASDGIIIPSNFTEMYLSEQQVNVTVYGSPASSTSGIVSGTVSGYVNYFNLQRFNGTMVIGLTSATVNTEQTSYIDFLIPGLIGFSILTNPMFSLVNISADYKKNKLFKQLSLTPLTKMEWLIAKVLFYIALSAAGFLLMVGVGVFAFGAHITLSPWLIPFLIL